VQRLLSQAARLGLAPGSGPGEAWTHDEDGGGEDFDTTRDQVGLADYLGWLAEDIEAGQVDPGTFGTLGLVLGELRTHPVVATLSANHGLRVALAAADQLRADYAELRQIAASTNATQT
jgi:hypothetical protein